jgi:hypothetical protein
MAIPPFDESGNLPEGIWEATIEEVKERYAYNFRRRWHLERLEKAIQLIKDAEGTTLFLDGSFITSKDRPDDYDALTCKAEVGEKLDGLINKHPNTQKAEYGGEFYFAENIMFDALTGTQKTFLDFFQTDTRSSEEYIRKGIIRIILK